MALTVGRLDKQKNYANLIKCFEQDSIYSLKIIGEGIDKEFLEEKINKNNFNVTIHKNMQHKDLLLEMKKYKFFISSSLFEGNPKTVLEAMSSGCIVIASNIKNHRDIIKHNFNGKLYDLDEMNILKY